MVEILILAAAVLSLAFPEIGFAMFAYQPVVQYAAVGPVRIAYVLVLFVVIGFGLLAYRRRMPVLRQFPWKRAWPLALLAAFFAYIGIRGLDAPRPLMMVAMARTVKGLAVMGIGSLGFFCLLQAPERLRRFVYGLLIIGLTLCTLGMLSSALADWNHSLAAIPGQKRGLYRQAVLISLLIATALLAWRGRRVRLPQTGQALLALAVAAGWWTALQTGSRGLLGCVVIGAAGLIAAALWHRPTRRSGLLAAAASGLGLVLFLVANPANNRVRRVYRTTLMALSHATAEEMAAVAEERSPLARDRKIVMRYISLAPEGAGADEGAPIAVDRLANLVGEEGEISAASSQNPLFHIFGLKGEKTYRITYVPAGKGLEADVSLVGRLGFYSAALAIIRDHWLVGSGVGGYWLLTGGCYPHNVILEIGADLGSVGIFLFLAWTVPAVLMVGGMLSPSRLYVSSKRSVWMGAIGVVFLAALLFAQIGPILDDNRILFLLLPAICLYAPAPAPSDSRPNARTEW